MIKDERRKSERVSKLTLVSYKHYDKEEKLDSQGIGRTADISKHGLRLQMPEKFEEGTTLDVTVAIEEDIVDFLATVIYTKQIDDELFDVGLEILSASDKSKIILKNYIKELK